MTYFFWGTLNFAWYDVKASIWVMALTPKNIFLIVNSRSLLRLATLANVDDGRSTLFVSMQGIDDNNYETFWATLECVVTSWIWIEELIVYTHNYVCWVAYDFKLLWGLY